MLKLNSLLAAAVLAGGIGLCTMASNVVRAADPAPTTQKSDATPVNKMCAIESDNPIDPAVTTVYEGKTYGFCCKDCVAKFKKDPEKYAANAK